MGAVAWLGIVGGGSFVISVLPSVFLGTLGGILLYLSSDTIISRFFKKREPSIRFEQLEKAVKDIPSESDRINKRNQHREEVRGVYEKLAASYLSQSATPGESPYTWGSVSLADVRVSNPPNSDPTFDEAMVNLQCWPETYGEFNSAKGRLDVLNMEIGNVRKKALLAIRKVMEGHGLLDRGGGAPSSPKWSDDERILSLLVLRTVSDGKRYVKPTIGIQNGKWVCVLNPSSLQSEGGLVRGIDNEEEARPLVSLFESFGENLDSAMGEDGYYAKLCERITAVQGHVADFGRSYEAFKSGMLNVPVRHLRYLDFPGGGKCSICSGLRT